MSVFSDTVTQNNAIHTSELQRLNRIHRDIGQFFGKLGSYKCEPRTYGQFERLNGLKQKAWELRDANRAIAATLRHEPNAMAHGAELIEHHMQKFSLFSKEVLDYLGEVKFHRTTHV